MKQPWQPASWLRVVGSIGFGAALVWGGAALAQPAPGASEPAAAAPPPADAPLTTPVEALIVLVDAGDTGIEPQAVRAAIGRELQVPVSGATSGAAAVGVLEVSIDTTEVVMKYQAANGTEIYRRISRPANPDRAIDTVALLAGNLVRDQASELLDALRRRHAARLAAANTEAAGSSLGAEPARSRSTAPRMAKRRGRKPDQAAAESREDSGTPLGVAPGNLSLFHPVATFPDSDERFVVLEIGLLYSRLGALYGVGVSSGVMDVEGDEHGASVVGLWSNHRGALDGAKVAGGALLLRGMQRGLSVAGGATLASGDLYGLRVSGGVDLSRGNHVGVVLSGAANLLDGTFKGVQVAGGVNVLSGGATPGRAGYGLQLAGGVNIWEGTWRGLQIGGVNVGIAQEVAAEPEGDSDAASPVASEPRPARVEGAQISVIGGDGGHLTGAQITGGVNVAASVRGAQIGPINVARRVTGMQIGLVNVAEEVDGVALGLVSIAKNGGIHAVSWASNQTLFNAGVKSRAGPMYTIWAAGIHPGSGDADYVVEPSFAVGGHVPIRSFFLEPELGYAWRVPMKGNESVSQHHVTRLRAKVGWQLWEPLALFAGGGAQYDATDRELGPEVLGGVQLF